MESLMRTATATLVNLLLLGLAAAAVWFGWPLPALPAVAPWDSLALSFGLAASLLAGYGLMSLLSPERRDPPRGSKLTKRPRLLAKSSTKPLALRPGR